MIPKLTDQAIGDLPLSHGRAELLEEIMSTPVLDDAARTTAPSAPPRRTARWAVPLAAAASVAALATSPVWWPEREATPVPLVERVPDGGAASQPGGPAGYRAVLEAPGWAVEHVDGGDDHGVIAYGRGSRWVEISWYPAASHESYVEDREHITDPPAPGQRVEVLGAAGLLWAYDATDHTVIREPELGHWLEVRAGGMDRQAYLDLLGALRLVDEEAFEAALPAEYVTADEREQEVQRLLEEIRDVTGVGFPEPTAVTSEEAKPYHLGADVAGAYACAWLDAYVDATERGDDQAAERATRVLATARDWPVLQRMAKEGGYPSAVWGYADDVMSGRVPEGYEGGLGC